MSIIQRVEKWSSTHHPRWLVLPRIVLGVFLILKGISFIRNTVYLESLLADSRVGNNGPGLALVITWLHLLCGLLIIIGLFTRLATLMMIPIVLSAVIFINAPRGIFAAGSEFGFSLAILLMLVFFFIEGGGPLSLDDYFRKNPK